MLGFAERGSSWRAKCLRSPSDTQTEPLIDRGDLPDGSHSPIAAPGLRPPNATSEHQAWAVAGARIRFRTHAQQPAYPGLPGLTN
jgi:hypothetical protein